MNIVLKSINSTKNHIKLEKKYKNSSLIEISTFFIVWNINFIPYNKGNIVVTKKTLRILKELHLFESGYKEYDLISEY